MFQFNRPARQHRHAALSRKRPKPFGISRPAQVAVSVEIKGRWLSSVWHQGELSVILPSKAVHTLSKSAKRGLAVVPIQALQHNNIRLRSGNQLRGSVDVCLFPQDIAQEEAGPVTL